MASTGSQVGDWVLESRLGAGGMGVVWRATHASDGRVAAVKTLSDEGMSQADLAELSARLRREAEVLVTLDHPAIVRPLESFEEAGRFYLVLELVDGRPLDEWLSDSPSPTRAIELLRRIAEGLEYAHGLGVVHRDMKPANVIVGPDDRPKILDFGLARAVGSAKLTRTGVVMGTIAFMAPEQALGRRVDHRADIFSAGMMLARVVGCRLPFEPPEQMALYRRLLSDQPVELDPWLPEEIRTLLKRMLSKDVEGRLSSATELVAELVRLLQVANLDDMLDPSRRSGGEPAGGPPRLPYCERPEIEAGVEEQLGSAAGGQGGGLLILAPPGSGRSTELGRVASRVEAAGIPCEKLFFSEGAIPGMVPWNFVSRLRTAETGTDETVTLQAGAGNPREVEESLFSWLRAGLELGPRALFLDDLHFAPPEDFGWIQRLLNQVGTSRLFLVLTVDSAREGAAPASSDPLGAFLSTVASRGAMKLVELAPVSEPTLVARLRQIEVEETDAVAIARLSGGIPGVVNRLLESRWLGRAPSRLMPGSALLLERRLEARWSRLDPVAKETIRVLVEAGGEIEIAQLVEKVGRPRLALMAHLRDLEKRHAWVRTGRDHVELTQPFLGALKDRSRA